MTNHPRRFGASSGFTLLEILVVMVIAGLMIALVPPMFSSAVSGTKVKGAARDLVIQFRKSRTAAITRNAEQQIHLDLVNQQYRIGDQQPVQLPDAMRMEVELITGQRIETDETHVIRYFPDGSSSGESITLAGANHGYRLTLDWLTGGITIRSGDSDAG